ncbi:hypothetical protein [Phormidium sp. CCY1219]|uniref:hypothetical protein n=1 Tax=Phormidium sp. CCY1219 TaxID=2886104 RepID=UPI002D1F66A2|nr:hypothetical protein [Phormidium sp. CCY1219]MEB3828861.1 hypothetical protein [Phormidium sp. CCY1219]
MEPSEFCQRWIVDPAPGEWGYRQACTKLLAEATGLSERSIENWGKDFSNRPDYILLILQKDNALREIQLTLTQLEKLIESALHNPR